ncbi:MAG TPA: 50S ribosomal protein L4 [Actinobacteria bacterium]|nr:50S ribosomal protein L4 [Actinomycetota bacterium]
MASVSVVDRQGNQKEKLKIADELVKTGLSEEVIYQDIRRYLAQIRSGTHSTKGRSEVRGGGRKPWRQKGTGNARAGTIRSPLWKGGGIVFGPKPRDHSFKLNKKVIRKSKAIALSEKFKNGKLIVVDDLGLKKVSTKKAAKIIEDLKVANKKILLVTDNLNDNDSKSFRNINNVVVESAKGVNAYYLMFSDYVIFTKNSLNKLIERMTDGKSKS